MSNLRQWKKKENWTQSSDCRINWRNRIKNANVSKFEIPRRITSVVCAMKILGVRLVWDICIICYRIHIHVITHTDYMKTSVIPHSRRLRFPKYNYVYLLTSWRRQFRMPQQFVITFITTWILRMDEKNIVSIFFID